jgi:hypothetical protein
MATSLLNALFTVGRPRRRRLLSTESSWMSVAVWISSTTTAPQERVLVDLPERLGREEHERGPESLPERAMEVRSDRADQLNVAEKRIIPTCLELLEGIRDGNPYGFEGRFLDRDSRPVQRGSGQVAPIAWGKANYGPSA